jgi:hypothetical protein
MISFAPQAYKRISIEVIERLNTKNKRSTDVEKDRLVMEKKRFIKQSSSFEYFFLSFLVNKCPKLIFRCKHILFVIERFRRPFT